jgi:hypothetical protein
VFGPFVPTEIQRNTDEKGKKKKITDFVVTQTESNIGDKGKKITKLQK